MLTNYNGELELNLKAFGRFLKKKIWIVLAAAVFWGMFWFFLWETVTVPMYESSSRMIVQKNAYSQENSIEENGIYADYFIETATSGPVIGSIISELELDVSYEKLISNINVYKTSGTNTVNISVYHEEAKTAQKLVEEIQKKTIAYMQETIGEGTLAVIEEAYLPAEPLARHNETKALYGAFGAFGITLAIVVLTFLFNTSLKDSDDVKSCLNEEVFAIISEAKRENQILQNKEAYRLLRTNLEYMENAPKAISVISCEDHDGKSTVAYELACTYARNGKKVFLIDGDLRTSSLKQKFAKNKEQQGLKELLSGKYDPCKFCCQTEIKNMDVLLAGKPAADSTELLDSQWFGELLDEVKANYEMVIVDTPSMKQSIDGAVITRQCDGALYVIAAEKTKCSMAKEMKMQIEKIGGRILGCVVTKFPKK